MHISVLLSLLSLLALVSSAPHSHASHRSLTQRRHHRRQHSHHYLHKKAHCDAKAASSASEIGVAAIAAAPTEFQQKGIGAWDKGDWEGWGSHQSSSAVAAPSPPASSPATQPVVAPAPPASSAAVVTPPVSSPVAPPVDTAVAPPVSSPAAPPVDTAVVSPVQSAPAAYSTSAAPPPVSQPVASAPASSALGPPASTAPAGGTSAGGAGGPLGIGIDNTSGVQLADAPGLSWYWNWGVTPFAMGTVEFVACVWGEEMANGFDGTVPAGTTHIMSFNEPDMGPDVGGCDIKDVAKAASLHQAWTSKLSSDVRIGSPAVARGGDVTWFTPWVTACAGNCRYDFVPIHFYGDKVEDMIAYIKAFPSGGKPIWVTEFDCQDFGRNYVCTAEESQYFMETAIAWFRGEGASIVERWAWFGAFPKFADQSFGLLTADGAVNPTGQHYLSL
ncbi:hypothetical protein I316_00261 [Kwoniella heveanensis BCC8398]|uniref:Asl1-like glycosyl hydrolase catalytic domain-containing protein n=1 Tax=Kwoniella heveanensis BCC8398 TaxID=1296120 RepID=A0A1B9H446_9TREE|nr:hypothetical protein I316_00261 [Kwoniella heveanensis BCC8398]